MTRIAPIYGTLGRVSEVAVATCQPDDPSSPKGSRTWNHIFPVTMLAHRGRRMLARRVRGEEVGNHFHPRVENKDPEVFVFLHGEIEFWFRDLYGIDLLQKINVNAHVDAPVMVILPPYVLHGIVVKSEWALFEEFQTGPFDQAANYSPAEFEALRKHLLERKES